MHLTGWRKLWLFTALVLLFFPCMFVLLEFQTQAKIVKHWSTSVVWKTQSEIPQYREIGVWYIRQQYPGFGDHELIAALESRFPSIDYSAIRADHERQLENIRRDQCGVVAEALTIYSCTLAVLYFNLWLAALILRKLGNSLSRRKI
ncbi:MAG: hypothetical protein ACRESZ_14750 [Methylococcales bacterium]